MKNFCSVFFSSSIHPQKQGYISPGAVTLKITSGGNHNLITKNCVMGWLFFLMVLTINVQEKPYLH